MERSDVNIKFLLPVLCFICSLYGIYQYVNNQEKNMCEMTYMFEYPEYLKIPLKYDVAQRFQRYNLFIYGEGKYLEELEKQNLLGAPVLFIPGNAGSHRQVRSLASVALRMGHSLHSAVHFNFFAIDFDEESSGLYGGTLKDQTEFVLACVAHIKSLYSSEKKVILIGHSMGGAISKAAFSLPAFNPSDISLIVTLASPQRDPVVASDSALVEFYSTIRETWKYRLKKGLIDIPIISIGGGQRDILVRSDLTSNNFQHISPADIHVLTTSIPGVWLSTDHLAIVWCKQLVLTICRSLYDLTDKKTKQISTSNSAEVESILRHHYISRSSGTHYTRSPVIPHATFTSTGQWIEQESNSWRFSRSKVLSTIYLLVPLTQADSIIIVATGMVKRDWIFGCTRLSGTETKTCIEGDNLSEKGEIIPSKSKKSERRMINLSSQELHLKHYSYILIYITPLDSQVDILGERYNYEQRTKHFDLPPLYQRFYLTSSVRIMAVSLPEQSVFYNLTISQSYGIFESAEFQLETRLCRAGSVVGQGIIKVHVPWSNEDSYHHIRTALGGLTTIPIRGHFLPPPNHNHDVNLQLILDPECSVVLTAKFPLYVIASQFVKFYGIYIIGYTVSLLLAFLSGQMFCYESSGSYLSFYKVFGYYPTYVSLVAVPSVLYHCLLAPELGIPFLPSADRVVMNDNGLISTLILRTLLYLTACGLILTFYTAFVLSLAAISKLLIWLRRKTILKLTEVPLENDLRSKVRLSKVKIGWCAFIGAISIVFSSSLGAVLAFSSYFLKLVSTHTRCKAEEERRGPMAATTNWYVHATLVLMWMCIVCLVSPGLIAWIKGLEFSIHVPNDPYTFPCVLMILSTALIWQLPTPSFNRIGYKKASHVIHILASFTTLYGMTSVYRHLYFISSTFIIVCVQQTYAYFHGPLFPKRD